MKSGDLILSSEAARMLGITADSVRCMDRRGFLPALRANGGVRLFDRRDVARLTRQRAKQRRQTASCARCTREPARSRSAVRIRLERRARRIATPGPVSRLPKTRSRAAEQLRG